MENTIENRFFKAFEMGGVVDNCIDWVRYTYNLPLMKPRKNNEQIQNEAVNKWDRYYQETLPKRILEAREKKDDGGIMCIDSPLMQEIENNLEECTSSTQRERYLFSLLKPFGESGCNIAMVYNPITEINRLEKRIKEACTSEIKDGYVKQKEWVEYVSRRFCEITGKFGDGAKWMQNGTVESCLSDFASLLFTFADRLDALLLENNIDLLRLQKESGIYLKSHRIITDVDFYIGSRELAQKYIDALPKVPQQAPEPQQELKEILPDKLKDNEAVIIFQKAIDANLIIKTNNSLVWKDTKQLLAYFAEKMSNKFFLINKSDKDGKKMVDWKIFETIFGEKNIKGAKMNWMRLNTKFAPTGFEKIDVLFK